MIKIKTKEEIEIMRQGGRILAEILYKLEGAAQSARTTNDLEKLARELVSSHGVKASFLNYRGYSAVLCTSVNDEVVHGLPSDYRLKEGDVLKIDMGILHQGFHTDSALTVLIGDSKDNEKLNLISVTREALQIGIENAKSGNTLGDLGHSIQEYVESRGLNVVRDLVGHGIGRELHETPEVLNYLPAGRQVGKPGEGETLKPGMVIAIEPMVVAGDWKIKEGEDGFSFKTKDGSLSAHFEHTIAITENGPEILTERGSN